MNRYNSNNYWTILHNDIRGLDSKVKQQRKVTDIDLLHLQSERDVILTDNSDGNTNKMKLQLIEEITANAVV